MGETGWNESGKHPDIITLPRDISLIPVQLPTDAASAYLRTTRAWRPQALQRLSQGVCGAPSNGTFISQNDQQERYNTAQHMTLAEIGPL